jgi:hypothetical protein
MTNCPNPKCGYCQPNQPKPLEEVAKEAFYASVDKEFGGHHWRAVADAIVAAYKERGGS